MTELSKLRWRCRRGMKELDVLLEAYLERVYGEASEEEKRVFADLLNLEDPDLFRFLSGRETPKDPLVADVVRRISGSADS